MNFTISRSKYSFHINFDDILSQGLGNLTVFKFSNC